MGIYFHCYVGNIIFYMFLGKLSTAGQNTHSHQKNCRAQKLQIMTLTKVARQKQLTAVFFYILSENSKNSLLRLLHSWIEHGASSSFIDLNIFADFNFNKIISCKSNELMRIFVLFEYSMIIKITSINFCIECANCSLHLSLYNCEDLMHDTHFVLFKM